MRNFWNQMPNKALLLPIGILGALLAVIYIYVDPAPPKRFAIATSETDGNYFQFGKAYQEFIAKEGIQLEVKESKGAWDNIKFLEDPKSNVEVAFVQDGLGTRQKHPTLNSLGSVFYEPIWVFYRGDKKLTRFNQFEAKKIGVGERGGEVHTMAVKLLASGGVDDKKADFVTSTPAEEVTLLKEGKIEVAFFIASPTNEEIVSMIKEPKLHLMSVDQAEAINRQFPYLHHLVLPHGTFDLAHNIPEQDIDLLSPTATLVVRNKLHPALVYLLLKAASKVHRGPGIFERRKEFPTDKDYVFPLNPDAKNFYQSGAPFWLRYLPFWLATLVERFIFLVIPALALGLPVVRAVPRFLQWRIRNRIYQRYGELKHIETKLSKTTDAENYKHQLEQLDKIEERVNVMKIPLDFSEYVYSLRGHIQFVRDRIETLRRQAGEKL